MQEYGIYAWLANVDEAKQVNQWASPHNRQLNEALQRGPVRYFFTEESVGRRLRFAGSPSKITLSQPAQRPLALLWLCRDAQLG